MDPLDPLGRSINFCIQNFCPSTDTATGRRNRRMSDFNSEVEKHINWESPNGKGEYRSNGFAIMKVIFSTYRNPSNGSRWRSCAFALYRTMEIRFFKKDTDKTWEEHVKLIWRPEWLID